MWLSFVRIDQEPRHLKRKKSKMRRTMMLLSFARIDQVSGR
jgi:hypothetical protein